MKRLSDIIKPIAWRRLLLVAIVAASAGQAFGQPASGRIYDEQLRVKLDQIDPETREKTFDAGGWFNLAIFHFDDPVARRKRNMRQYELRAWASMNFQGVHTAYVRGVAGLNDWSGGRSNDSETGIERAWYQLDLGKLLQNDSGKRPPIGVKVRLGRDFMSIGTALALSTTLDMGKIEITAGDWELMGFLGHTLRDSWNLDESVAVANRQSRWITGAEIAYRGFSQHRPFVYYMHNNDRTNPSSTAVGSIMLPNETMTNASYEYDSDYIGAGSTGTLCVSNLRYQIEGVVEFGRTYPNNGVSGVTGRDRIQAWAMDAAVEYVFVDCPTKPRVGFEYLYASGDSDRTSSPISTDGGNLAGTSDGGFGGFGFRDLGIAASPEISNIHVYVLSASCQPLEHIELFEKMEVGTKLFYYSRAKGSGPISDTTTRTNANATGFEMDFFCNWRVTSDLAWTVRYGSFFPGAAYDGGDKSPRQFLYSGLVFSF